jgi:hypothetical protein
MAEASQSYFFWSRIASARTASPKSSASVLSVLFFNVTKASGLVVVGKAIGSDLRIYFSAKTA